MTWTEAKSIPKEDNASPMSPLAQALPVALQPLEMLALSALL